MSRHSYDIRLYIQIGIRTVEKQALSQMGFMAPSAMQPSIAK